MNFIFCFIKRFLLFFFFLQLFQKNVFANNILYLEDNFFQVPELEEFITNDFSIPENFLSAHYYITRVLHSMLIKDKPLKRNSEFVNFFTNALDKKKP